MEFNTRTMSEESRALLCEIIPVISDYVKGKGSKLSETERRRTALSAISVLAGTAPSHLGCSCESMSTAVDSVLEENRGDEDFKPRNPEIIKNATAYAEANVERYMNACYRLDKAKEKIDEKVLQKEIDSYDNPTDSDRDLANELLSGVLKDESND